MREIKFRLMLGGHWHYWGFIALRGGLCFSGLPSSNMDTLSIEEMQEKSQQYTGKKDRNGVGIWEGDIVAAFYGDEEPQELQVEFRNGAFVIDYEDSESDVVNVGEFVGALEVIGNIYERKGEP